VLRQYFVYIFRNSYCRLYSVFCFILFYFVLFCFILFCFTLSPLLLISFVVRMSEPRSEFMLSDSPLVPLHPQLAATNPSATETLRPQTRVLSRSTADKAAVLQNLTSSFETTMPDPYANVNTNRHGRSMNRQSLGLNQSIISGEASFAATPGASVSTTQLRMTGSPPSQRAGIAPTPLVDVINQQNEIMRVMQRRLEQLEKQAAPAQSAPVPRLPEPFAERGENLARLARFNGPTPFDGANARRDFRVLRSFIMEMELWFSSTGVSPKSMDSFTMARMKLKGEAAVWMGTLLNSGHTVGSWDRLKALLKKRYESQHQDGFHLLKMINLRCRDGDIMSFNNEFMTHIDMLSYASESFKYAFELYRLALEQSSNTRWLVTQLNEAEDEGKFSQMNEVYNYTERCQSLFSRGAPNMLNRMDRSSSSRYPMLKGGANHSHSEGGVDGADRYRTPSNRPRSGFPSQLNNVGVETDAHENLDDEFADESKYDEVEEENGPDVVSTEATASDNVYLNAMKFFDTSRRFNPSGTPEQVEKDRLNNACFVCHKAGHQARQCPDRPKQAQNEKKKW
jgi:hypothetical protein